jgi:putative NADH-flavin reductase
MKIALVGATGMIGQRVLTEASARGHDVTAISRNPSSTNNAARTVAADATDSAALESAIRSHDAVISAIGPSRAAAADVIVEATRALAAACTRADVRRVIVVNGAGSLAVQPGVELLSTPDFRSDWRPVALAHREALEIWRRVKELDWTVVSPAALIEPGERRGKYRIGHNDLLVDENGKSHISAEDFAAGIVDELETNSHIGERITLGY